ncbi:hypothetical protein AGABI1DRAFT_127447 [Agaricus bisporus var. burnettii JB137-S8]|uniref:Cytochrome P450 n=1 Tax=Agaricus bisporus var. burnettii (strain JB137-S8 / ATCC MYA-4627 / FGSC 10392) TaxID=597362 RepID=K5X974_AGABU|nr:uncharacterized protein AGABI1DRAFT_127447 [Agaricus bisporus var. burnettii JB137-S8]EKM79763.1 hypothetical protein AGABI1DRAFT_127447 [Agaricus bisporus var. burnettii JB137-S8]
MAPLRLVAGIVALTLLIVIRRRKRLRLRASMPPGPELAWFGLGDNQRDMPKHEAWKTFTKWYEQYGPVVSVLVGSTNVIVLGTVKAATDLLEKRGSIYSSRHRQILAGEIYSGGMRGIGMPYGRRWRNWRSLIHSGLSIEASKNYKPQQSLEARILVKDFMDAADYKQLSFHLRRFAVSVVLNVGYGERIKTLHDKMVVENMEIDRYFLKILSSNSVWPILLRLPKWLQWFRWEPERMRHRDTMVYMGLLDGVKERIANKTDSAKPSVAVRGLEKQQDWGLNDIELAYACSAPWQAGGSTTSQAIHVFLFAMLLNPDVLEKAQEEIDRVVGRSRQPEFDDIDTLPYVDAICKEVLRWRPVIPIGVAHCNTTADVYEGMYIPAGSKVYANIDLMSKDPVAYPSPDEFKPERWLGPNPAPAFPFSFGFGRRQCPGMHIATNALFIVASKLIWAFDIKARVDPLTGRPVILDPDDMAGDLVRGPRDVPCVLQVRGNSEQTRALILAEAEAAETEALEFTP